MLTNENFKPKISLISLSQVAAILNIKDGEATKRWVLSNGIEIIKMFKQNYVYDVDVEFAINKPFVLRLKKRYPNKWKEIYAGMVGDSPVYQLIICELDVENVHAATTKVKLKTSGEKELQKKLLS